MLFSLPESMEFTICRIQPPSNFNEPRRFASAWVNLWMAFNP